MKKLISIVVFALLVVSPAFAQISSNGKPKVLKSFYMGVCKLIDTDGAITIEAISRESAQYKVIVHLGTPQEAKVTLAGLAEYKPSKGETVSLNNPSNNEAYYQKLNGAWVITEKVSDIFSIAVTRGELRKMVKELSKY